MAACQNGRITVIALNAIGQDAVGIANASREYSRVSS
jgi:hypothetical protein